MPENQPGKGLGHFFGAMRIDAFRPAQNFKDQMDLWIERFRNAIPAPGHEKVLIPGDPEREMEAIRSSKGWELVEAVETDLQAVAQKFAIAF